MRGFFRSGIEGEPGAEVERESGARGERKSRGVTGAEAVTPVESSSRLRFLSLFASSPSASSAAAAANLAALSLSKSLPNSPPVLGASLASNSPGSLAFMKPMLPIGSPIARMLPIPAPDAALPAPMPKLLSLAVGMDEIFLEKVEPPPAMMRDWELALPRDESVGVQPMDERRRNPGAEVSAER